MINCSSRPDSRPIYTPVEKHHDEHGNVERTKCRVDNVSCFVSQLTLPRAMRVLNSGDVRGVLVSLQGKAIKMGKIVLRNREVISFKGYCKTYCCDTVDCFANSTVALNNYGLTNVIGL